MSVDLSDSTRTPVMDLEREGFTSFSDLSVSSSGFIAYSATREKNIVQIITHDGGHVVTLSGEDLGLGKDCYLISPCFVEP